MKRQNAAIAVSLIVNIGLIATSPIALAQGVPIANDNHFQPVYLVASAKKQRIAILDFRTEDGVPGGLGRALADTLRTNLIEKNKFVVVERSMIDKVISEQAFSKSGYVDEGNASKIGQLLDAQFITVGSIAKIGDYLTLNIRVLSVETGEAVTSRSHRTTNPNQLLLAIDRIALSLDESLSKDTSLTNSTSKLNNSLTLEHVKKDPFKNSYIPVTSELGGYFRFNGDDKSAFHGINLLDGVALPKLREVMADTPKSLEHLNNFTKIWEDKISGPRWLWLFSMLCGAILVGSGALVLATSTEDQPKAQTLGWVFFGIGAPFFIGGPIGGLISTSSGYPAALRELTLAVDEYNQTHSFR